MNLHDAVALCEEFCDAAPAGDPATLWGREVAALDDVMGRLAELPDWQLGALLHEMCYEWPRRTDPYSMRAALRSRLAITRADVLEGRFGVRVPRRRGRCRGWKRKRGLNAVAMPTPWGAVWRYL